MERETEKGYQYNSCDFMEDGVYLMANKLREYEDAEEQGLLLRLPCNAGDTVYRINKAAKNPIIAMSVITIAIRYHANSEKSLCLFCKDALDFGENYFRESEIGRTLFLTKEAAEKELQKQEGEQ